MPKVLLRLSSWMVGVMVWDKALKANGVYAVRAQRPYAAQP